MSLRDQILARAQVAPVLVPLDLPTWGEGLFVREMNAAERDAFEAEQLESSKAGKALANFRAKLVVRVVVDKDGARIFSDADAAQIGQLPAHEVRRAFDVAMSANAISADEQRELEKNS